MRVVLTTVDGRELTISEGNAKKDEFAGYAEGQPLAILEIQEQARGGNSLLRRPITIKVDADELSKAVDVLWSDRDSFDVIT